MAGGFVIQVEYDQAPSSLPAGFTAAVAAVTQRLEQAFTDPVTLVLHVGFGEAHGRAIPDEDVAHSSFYLDSYSYQNVTAALRADAKSALDMLAVRHLDPVDPTGGAGLLVSQALAQALGLEPAATPVEGWVGFRSDTAFDFDPNDGVRAGAYDFQGLLAHEITEVMGREIAGGTSYAGQPDSYLPLDLLHFQAPGAPSTDATQPGYFSVDGGATDLKDFNTVAGFDYGDWAASAGDDAFLAVSYTGRVNAVSAADVAALDAIGWDAAAPTVAPADPAVTSAAGAVLRTTATPGAADLVAMLASDRAQGVLTLADAVEVVVAAASASTSVATLTYTFFTGRTPTPAGIDYLVSPSGPNPNNLDSAYYQSFNLENRYINFAVNLGKVGEGAAAFAQAYGALSFYDAFKMAYGVVFGAAPSDQHLHDILDPTLTLNGQTITRQQYFADYGGDGLNGIGTKAAAVGWLMSEAEKADLGAYAKSNDAFLTDVANGGAGFGVDLIGVYDKPEYAYHA